MFSLEFGIARLTLQSVYFQAPQLLALFLLAISFRLADGVTPPKLTRFDFLLRSLIVFFPNKRSHIPINETNSKAYFSMPAESEALQPSRRDAPLTTGLIKFKRFGAEDAIAPMPEPAYCSIIASMVRLAGAQSSPFNLKMP